MNTQPQKKLLSLSLVVMLLVSLCPITTQAASDYTYQITADGTLAITGYTGESTKLEIPDQIDGAKVTAIADQAFQYQYTLQEVQIPDGVTSIGEGAFNDCSGLTSVIIPDSVTSIGKDAFFSCTRLTSIDLPDYLSELGDGAFYHCMSLESIELPGTLADFGDYTFGACSELQKAVLDDGITEVPQQTFFDCSKLSDVSLPQSVNGIGMRAFHKCRSLTDITFPDELERIEKRAFEDTKLSDIYVNAQHIEKNAFTASVIVGEVSVSLGDAVEDIEPLAFNYPSLKSYQTDSENPYYETSDDGILYTKGKTELVACPPYFNSSDISINLEIPSGVEKIDSHAFSACQNLSVITLPETVTTIGDYAFSDSSVTSVNLPESLTDLGAYAFSSCINLNHIEIPSGITELKEYAFSFCPNLSTVTLPDNLQKIGGWAFANCSSISTIHLPDSLLEIDGSTFSGCGSSDEMSYASYEAIMEDPEIDEMESEHLEEIHENNSLVDTYNEALSTVNSSGEFRFEIDENPYFSVENDKDLYSNDKTELVAYLTPVTDGQLHLPDTVTTLRSYSVLTANITELEIPDSITTLQDNSVGYIPSMTGSDFRLYGKAGSVAQTYAQKYGFGFFTGKPEANTSNLELSAGETFQYTISNIPDGLLSFASSDNLVASVDASGLITAKANGTAEIFAVTGTSHFSVPVTVTGGEDPVDPYSSFREILMADELSDWEQTYVDYNQNAPLSLEDNININDYSSDNYIAIKEKLIGGGYTSKCDTAFEPGGYGQFGTVTQNMGHELSRFQLNSDLKVYSGTQDISFITGGGSSINEMLASIGKTVTDPCVISTSLAHSIAASHGKFMLEIYAPKDLTNGAYINPISAYKGENELLLNYNLTYKVLDAGIRNAEIKDTFETYTSREYYIKLLLNPQTDPENPDTPVNPDEPSNPDTPANPETPANPDTPGSGTPEAPQAPAGAGSAKPSSANTAASGNAKSSTTKTGDSLSQFYFFLLLAGGSGLLLAFCLYYRYRISRKQE